MWLFKDFHEFKIVLKTNQSRFIFLLQFQRCWGNHSSVKVCFVTFIISKCNYFYIVMVIQSYCPNWCLCPIYQSGGCTIWQTSCNLQKSNLAKHSWWERLLGHPMLWCTTLCSSLALLFECNNELLVHNAHSLILLPTPSITFPS